MAMPNDSRGTPVGVLSSRSLKATIDTGDKTQYHSDTLVSKGTNIDDLSTVQRPQLFIQVCGCLVASLSQVGVACISTFSGITIPELTSCNNDLFLHESSAALFGSLPNMGAIFGSLLTAALTVSVGQRVILLLALPLTLLCWLGIAFANSVSFLLGARFLLGLTVGTLKYTPYIYVVEISHEMYRGTLSGIIDVTRGLGIIFSYSIGSLSLTWRQMALVFGFTTTIPPFIGLLFFHDSPRWLASKGYLEKSSKALQFFRGRQYNIDKEFADVTIKAKESLCSKSNAFSQIKQLADPSIRKRFAIICLMTLLRFWGGSGILLSYTATIFNETNSCSDPHICSILVGVGKTVGAILFFLSGDYIGRRPGFIFSSLVCSVSIFTLGTYFYINTYYEGELVTSLSWLPLVSVLVISCSASTTTAIQSLISCEILPLSFRLMGNGMISTISYILLFTVVETFLSLKNALGLYGVFWLYSFFLASSSYVPLALLPETKGKTLEEIENTYKNVEDRK